MILLYAVNTQERKKFLAKFMNSDANKINVFKSEWSQFLRKSVS